MIQPFIDLIHTWGVFWQVTTILVLSMFGTTIVVRTIDFFTTIVSHTIPVLFQGHPPASTIINKQVVVSTDADDEDFDGESEDEQSK